MSSRPMTLYLWSALGIAIFSVAISGTILLFGLTSIGPFDPPLNRAMEHIGHVATFSAAVSGIFALMVGAIAIIAVIVAERAETRSIEQLKIDISRLWMALHSLRNRGLLYTSPEAARGDLDLFSQERQTIHEVLNSPTGFSIFAWQAAHEDRGFTDLTADLSGLINLTTLDLGENRVALFNSISIRANKIAERVSVLTDSDISEMASIVKRLGSGLDQAREIASKDNISNFLKEMDSSWKKELAPPTQAEVEVAADAAQAKIGGEAGKTVRHFGNKAVAGSEEDVATWHRLIEKLGLHPHGQSEREPERGSVAPSSGLQD